eukprot:TRINITY_DN114648_c0_g1_i1.p1 TRINITY_DN114648_c0_g1~~TRINITY_DN114648_c0_g1_i1.p1  ORF type:complete len:466 (-),score=110.90 TRINITY_DN114648_c0_g1_i1:97-1494(-)
MATLAEDSGLLDAGCQVGILGKPSDRQPEEFAVYLGDGRRGHANVMLGDASVQQLPRSRLVRGRLAAGDFAIVVGSREKLYNGEKVQLLLPDTDGHQPASWKVRFETGDMPLSGNTAVLPAACLVRHPGSWTLPGETKVESRKRDSHFCLATALNNLQRVMKQPDAFYDLSHSVARTICELVGCTILPFGSTVQRTSCRGSDIDLMVVVDDQAPADQQLQAALLKRVAAAVRSDARFMVLEEVLSAKIPLLRVKYEDLAVWESAVELDVTVGDDSLSETGKAVSEQLRQMEAAADLIVLVKSWARFQGVHGVAVGCLSSHAWTLFVLFALQRRRGQLVDSRHAGHQLSSVYDALLYLDGLPARDRGISATSAQTFRRPKGSCRRRQPLHIEDIAKSPRSSNAARSVTASGWQACVAAARRSARLLETGSPDAICRLFGDAWWRSAAGLMADSEALPPLAKKPKRD